MSASFIPVNAPKWKCFCVLLKNYQTNETEEIEVYAVNKGQAGFLGMRKSRLMPVGVEKVTEKIKERR